MKDYENSVGDEELLSIINKELKRAEDNTDIVVALMAEMDAGLDPKTDPDLQQVPGRFVTYNVLSTVRLMRDNLKEVFTGPDTLVEFAPISIQDKADAEIASAYVDAVAKSEMHAWLDRWIWDACAYGTGITKYTWKEETILEPVTMTDITRDEANAIISAVTESGQKVSDISIIDFEGKITLEYNIERSASRVVIVPVDLREFLIDPDATDVKNSLFVGHKHYLSRSELVDMGFDYEVVKALKDQNRFDDGKTFSTTVRPSASKDHLYLYELYMKVELPEEGRFCWYRVYYADKTILEATKVDYHPFAVLRPEDNVDTFYGKPFLMPLADYQKYRTALYRGVLQNVSQLNAPITYVNKNSDINLRALMNNEPGSIITGTGSAQDSISYITVPAIQPQVLDVMAMIEREMEQVQGFTDTSQGLDENTLSGRNTATAVNISMAAGKRQLKAMATKFAETGFKDLFLGIYKLMKLHSTPTNAALAGQGLPQEVIDMVTDETGMLAIEFKTRNTLKVNVGLTFSEKVERAQRTQQVMATLLQDPMAGRLHTEQMHYEALKGVCKDLGLDPASMIVDPSTLPPPSPPPPSIEEQKLQLEQARLQFEQQKFQMESQLEQAKLQMDAQLEAQKLQQQHQLEMMKLQIEQSRVAAELASQERLDQVEEATRMRASELEQAKFIADQDAKMADLQFQIEKMNREFNLEVTQNRAAKIGD